jgi:hypothetical protein
MLFCYLSFGVVYSQSPIANFLAENFCKKVLKFREFLPFALKNTPNFALLTFYVKPLISDVSCKTLDFS